MTKRISLRPCPKKASCCTSSSCAYATRRSSTCACVSPLHMSYGLHVCSPSLPPSLPSSLHPSLFFHPPSLPLSLSLTHYLVAVAGTPVKAAQDDDGMVMVQLQKTSGKQQQAATSNNNVFVVEIVYIEREVFSPSPPLLLSLSPSLLFLSSPSTEARSYQAFTIRRKKGLSYFLPFSLSFTPLPSSLSRLPLLSLLSSSLSFLIYSFRISPWEEQAPSRYHLLSSTSPSTTSSSPSISPPYVPLLPLLLLPLSSMLFLSPPSLLSSSSPIFTFSFSNDV